MKNGLRLPDHVLRRLHGSRRGQALVEMAFVAPVILLLISGVGDLGRAFYYKIAVTNAAREAAHWATLLDSNQTPPTDAEILNDIGAPSQESFGICLASFTPKCPGNGGLAPSSVVHTQPGTAGFTPQLLANPGNNQNLSKGQSYLYIYPDNSGRTSLATGMHWREVAANSQVILAPAPDKGGLQDVLKAIGGSLYPTDALADPRGCWTWSGVTLSPAGPFTVSGAPPYSLPAMTVSLTNPMPAQSHTAGATNKGDASVTQPAGGPAFTPTFAPAGTLAGHGSLDPSGTAASDLTMTGGTAPSGGPATYAYSVPVTTTGDNGCSVTTFNPTFQVIVQPSPSPSPSASPSASPTATPSVSPNPSPTSGSGPPPLGRQITCTVIYYFQPVTPLSLFAAQAVYIVGTATLQASY
jgi:hypothetical protein